MSSYLPIAFSVVGIYACFLSWGYFQEVLTTTPYGTSPSGKPDKFKFFIFMNVVQSLIACICAAVYAQFRRIDLSIYNLNPKLRNLYFIVGLTSCVASPLGYASLKFINFPTMTLSKSCKLVPVMFVQVLFYRKRYPLYKYVSVALITIGVFFFFYLQPSKGDNYASNSLYGIFLVVANLLLDGFTNSTEDVIFRNFHVNSTQLMFFLNLSQSILMTVYLMNPFNPELLQSVAFLMTYPDSFKDLILFSLAGAVGQTIIFFTLERFGSLTLVTITVTRKVVSIVLSVLAFGHEISLLQWFSVFFVFGGITMESYIKEISGHSHSHGHGHDHGHSHSHGQSHNHSHGNETVEDSKKKD